MMDVLVYIILKYITKKLSESSSSVHEDHFSRIAVKMYTVKKRGDECKVLDPRGTNNLFRCLNDSEDIGISIDVPRALTPNEDSNQCDQLINDNGLSCDSHGLQEVALGRHRRNRSRK